MARIAGVEIPSQKRVEASLQYVYGVGLTTVKQILSSTKISADTRVKDLTDKEVKLLNDYIAANIKVEGELRQIVQRNIKRLKDIKAYRGLRHKVGLPVRGQNTRKNARTRKGKHVAIALNRPVSKK